MVSKNNKEQFWVLLFILLPILQFGSFGNKFTENIFYSIFISALMGGLGGLLGGSVYRLVKQQSTQMKIIAFLLMSILGVAILYAILKFIQI